MNSNKKGIYFSELYLEGIKCFKKGVSLSFLNIEGNDWKRWTVILGNNGVGKTTLLQSLACLEIVEDGDSLGYYYRNIFGIGSHLKSAGFKEPSKIKANLYGEGIIEAEKEDHDLSIIMHNNGTFYAGRLYANKFDRKKMAIFSYGA